jgi:hypothetical protein
MGRAKKQSKWWKSQLDNRAVWLKPGDIIRQGDMFCSAGQWHPVSSTIGLPYHSQLPLMKRGVEIEHEQIVVSTRHQEFIDLAEMAGITLPHQFQQWRRFFLDEKNFLAEAEHWLSMRLQSRYHRIEDDVDKGLMTKTGAPSTNGWATSGWSDDDDYWTAWQGNGYKSFSGWGHVLPLVPKLDAPSGLSGAELVVL